MLLLGWYCSSDIMAGAAVLGGKLIVMGTYLASVFTVQGSVVIHHFPYSSIATVAIHSCTESLANLGLYLCIGDPAC